MSTFVYNNARFLFKTAQLNWPTAAVCAALVNANYSALATDQNMSQVPPAAIIARDVALTGLGVSSAGVCFGVIPEFNALESPTPVVALLLYVKGATDAESPLVYYSSDGVGFPFDANGFNYQIGFPLSAGGWFA